MNLFDKFINNAILILDNKQFHKDDDLVQEIDKEILDARELLEKVRKESEKERKEQQEELQTLTTEFRTKQSELYRLGRAAQRISLYDYALVIQAVKKQREGLSDTSKSKRNVFQDLMDDARKSERNLNAYGGTLVLRSQTVYASSAFLWQFMVSSVQEARFLRTLHVYGMLKSQSYMQRKGWNQVLKVCHKAIAEAPSILSEVESELMKAMYRIHEVMLEKKEIYEKALKLQRRIIGKLKMKQVIQLSTRSLGIQYNGAASHTAQSERSITSAPLITVTEQIEPQNPPSNNDAAEDKAEDDFQRRVHSAERRLSSWRKKKGVAARNLKRSSLASLRVEESKKRLDSFISFQMNIRNLDS
jgi:hypothetical protein